MEVVSDDRRDRMSATTRRNASDYAKAGIREYWIVDPQTAARHRLAARRRHTSSTGDFQRAALATSRLLDGFAVDVDAVFAAAKV